MPLLILLLTLMGILTPWAQAQSPDSDRLAAKVKVHQISKSAGRVDWYHGARHELIAFDTIVNNRTKNTEIFVMEPDGSNVTCVTCDAPIPKGFIGQPAWHPDGNHLIFQAESEHSQHGLYNH